MNIKLAGLWVNTGFAHLTSQTSNGIPRQTSQLVVQLALTLRIGQQRDPFGGGAKPALGLGLKDLRPAPREGR